MIKSIQYLGLVSLLAGAIAYLTGYDLFGAWGLTLGLFLLALGFRSHTIFSRFSFSLLVLGTVSLTLSYPEPFVQIGEFKMNRLIVPLLQLIMFGMGTAMSLADFGAVAKRPKAVFIGLICQFTIMPLIGALLITLFKFPAEIAAGIILVGSSPSGLASNVMAYIGKANLALSVTLTTVATLLAPFLTPLWMKFLGEQLIPIDVWAMMWSILKITILPILAGLLFNKLLHGRTAWLDKAMPFVSMGGIALIIAVITAAGRENLLNIGALLILAGFLHNVSGYFLGYWSCKVLGLDRQSCRTIAFEVGMQNAGLASGLANELGRVATVGLAPAVFGPMMNITGSLLASFWQHNSGKSNKTK